MKKLLLVIAIVIVIGFLGLGSVFAYENKYLWIPISEDQLRAKISEFYNLEIAKESCELNNSRGFASKENCVAGVKCISDELSKIIPANDLRRLANGMQDKAESEVINYFKNHQEIEQQYKNTGLTNCSNWLTQK